MQHPGRGIRLRSSARTSIGQIRENNEDNIHLWTRDDFVLAVVADGMGGAAAGEEASKIAVEVIQAGLALRDQRNVDNLGSLGDDALTERLRDTIQAANHSIVQKAATAPEFRGMGTTVTLAFVRGTDALVAHVGDSRAYVVDGDDGNITQITSDHSFVEALLAAGHITEEQALEHPMRNVLYRALGQAEDVDVDMYYSRLQIRDRMVLCSDGLTRHVRPHEIAELAMSDENPDVISQRLIDLANERGGEDNVSVIVILVEANDSGSVSTGEAIMTTPIDDDETLILKDRPAILRDIRERHNSSKPQNALVITTAAQPREDKMAAERLKDDDLHGAEDDTEKMKPYSPDDSIANSAAPREPVLSPAPDNNPTLTSPRRESQSEGRDTLMPEQ